MHFERPLEPGQLLVRQLCRDRLRERDERDLVGHRHERKVQPLGLVGERLRRVGPAEADPECKAGDSVSRQAADVLALGSRELADPEPGRDQQLTALEPRRRIRQLRDVDPADRVRGAARARRKLQTEAGQRCDVSDGEHRVLGLAWTCGPRRYSLRTGQKQGSATGRELEFTTPCRSRALCARPSVYCARARQRERIATCLSGSARRWTTSSRRAPATSREVSRRRSSSSPVRRARRWRLPTARIYLDFAGGIACQNTGHGFAPVVAAIHEQVDRFLHQCFMVGTYEPYVEVCRRLAEHSAVRGEQSRSRSSSTAAPRRSRTRSRSPARPRAALPLSSSTTASTAARC